jgi:hypothetical protein
MAKGNLPTVYPITIDTSFFNPTQLSLSMRCIPISEEDRPRTMRKEGHGEERIWRRKDMEKKGHGDERIWRRKDMEKKGQGKREYGGPGT